MLTNNMLYVDKCVYCLVGQADTTCQLSFDCYSCYVAKNYFAAIRQVVAVSVSYCLFIC